LILGCLFLGRRASPSRKDAKGIKTAITAMHVASMVPPTDKRPTINARNTAVNSKNVVNRRREVESNRFPSQKYPLKPTFLVETYLP
jgi:hypothetical protein